MNRITLAISIVLCFGPAAQTPAQTPQPDPSGILKQLLARPAPTPRTAEVQDGQLKQRPPSFYDENNPPPEDAPIDDLIEYWSRMYASNDRGPSNAVKRRLFDASLEQPEILPRLVDVIPQTDTVFTKVKELYDKELSDHQLGEWWQESVKRWLLFNTSYFLDELIAQANKVKEDKDGSVRHSEELVALAKVNWISAEPLIRGLAASGQPRAAALALALSYRHAIDEGDGGAEERYRSNLKTIAANIGLPAEARGTAVEALSSTEWSSRDDWYLGLFRDETLVVPTDLDYRSSPLTTLFRSDPDKWIPIMARMLESKDITVRSGAATCLLSYSNRLARKDALMPLLPWLSNPSWLKAKSDYRLKLIQSMAVADIPESVPGLIWVVDNDQSESSYERSYAALSLGKYKDPRAVPSLKKALAKERDDQNRNLIIQGLLAAQGLSEDEQVEALEAYAAKLISAEDRAVVERYHSRSEEPLPVPVSIGKYLSQGINVSDSLVQAVLNRAESLKQENPPLAQALLEVAHLWQGRLIDLDVIHRIANGSADAKLITQALERRTTLRETLRSELQALTAVNGLSQGVGIVLLDDPSMAQEVLNSEDQLTQTALLAAARLTQTPLPVEMVGPMLRSKNSLLASAAESYLLAEDSKEAQEFLWRHHPNQAFITGWRDSGRYIEAVPSQLARMEDNLRAELFKENGPKEIIALVADYGEESRVLRMYADKAVQTHYEDAARYREGTVSNAELASFKTYLTTTGLPDVGPRFSWCHHDCWSGEFIVLTKEKSRRVFAYQGLSAWSDLQQHFDLLSRGEDAKLHYNLEKEIKGLEILYADKRSLVKDVWQKGAEVRVLVEHVETDEEAEQRTKAEETDAEDEEIPNAEIRRRQTAHERSLLSWRVLSNNKLGAITSEPEIYKPVIDDGDFPPATDDDDVISNLEKNQVQRINANSIIMAQAEEGLWKQIAGTKPVRISRDGGTYNDPIVTPDGKWIVVAKADEEGSTYIVRFSLRTAREYRVNLEPADEFKPVAFIATHNKVLLSRSKGSGGNEYYLLDAATGETRPVTGEFQPLYQEDKRSLQPTGKPNEFWAAIQDEDKHQTQLGRYNLKDFSFKPVMLVPHVLFDSMAMWVDAEHSKLYIVYRDQLLRLPLSF